MSCLVTRKVKITVIGQTKRNLEGQCGHEVKEDDNGVLQGASSDASGGRCGDTPRALPHVPSASGLYTPMEATKFSSFRLRVSNSRAPRTAEPDGRGRSCWGATWGVGLGSPR